MQRLLRTLLTVAFLVGIWPTTVAAEGLQRSATRVPDTRTASQQGPGYTLWAQEGPFLYFSSNPVFLAHDTHKTILAANATGSSAWSVALGMSEVELLAQALTPHFRTTVELRVKQSVFDPCERRAYPRTVLVGDFRRFLDNIELLDYARALIERGAQAIVTWGYDVYTPRMDVTPALLERLTMYQEQLSQRMATLQPNLRPGIPPQEIHYPAQCA